MESQKPMANQPAATAAAKIKKEEKISQVRGIKNAFIVILCCCAAAKQIKTILFTSVKTLLPPNRSSRQPTGK